jgi:hypothetical protein
VGTVGSGRIGQELLKRLKVSISDLSFQFPWEWKEFASKHS